MLCCTSVDRALTIGVDNNFKHECKTLTVRMLIKTRVSVEEFQVTTYCILLFDEKKHGCVFGNTSH